MYDQIKSRQWPKTSAIECKITSRALTPWEEEVIHEIYFQLCWTIVNRKKRQATKQKRTKKSLQLHSYKKHTGKITKKQPPLILVTASGIERTEK